MLTDGGGMDSREVPVRVRVRRLTIVALIGILAVIAAAAILGAITKPRRTTPLYEPPVLAGQHIWAACSGGFYARLEDTIVLTSAGHCAAEGTVATDPDGTGIRGVFGPPARTAACPFESDPCTGPDVNYLVVASDRIPWGHLNVVDLGTAGYRTIPAETRPLACADIAIGDDVEIDGRNIYRRGTVAEKSEGLDSGDGSRFPCMIAATIKVDVGDSGGAVLVRGIPAGVTLRSYGGYLGFTPLAENLAALGITLCTTPDCDLVPAAGAAE